MSRLRFLCFNLHGGRSLDGQRDLSRVHALMERLDIDVGVFQEMETRPSRGGTAEDVDVLAGESRPYRLPGPSMKEGLGWYGNLETKPDLEPRNAADALIQGPHGNIRVIGTHLSLSIFERRSEARNLMRLMQAVEGEEQEKNPYILMGDINEWQIPSTLLRYLNKHMTPIPCKATFPSMLPIFRLDRVWTDAPGLKITAHRIPAKGLRRLSDHLPLVVEIDYGEAAQQAMQQAQELPQKRMRTA